MKKFTHMDNIHLTAEGYKKLADSVIAAAQSMMSRPHPVPAARKGIEKVHWHGFTFTTGYGRLSRATPYTPTRGRGGRHHPYKR